MLLQHWGYYYSALTPAAVVNSGDTIVVETSTQHGGDDYDKLVRGDPGMEVGATYGLAGRKHLPHILVHASPSAA